MTKIVVALLAIVMAQSIPLPTEAAGIPLKVVTYNVGSGNGSPEPIDFEGLAHQILVQNPDCRLAGGS
jgi:hypothetical protein